jgi:hypothetical protein
VPTLHIALDEGGDLNFAAKGSKFYVFAAAWTYDPARLAQALTQLRFGLFKAGNDIPSFHATEDKQTHRDAVVRAVTSFDAWQFIAIVVDKRKVNPSFMSLTTFTPSSPGWSFGLFLRDA